MTQPVTLDPYILDVLMRDLVGHDHTPSAFLVYLWLWGRTRAAPGGMRPAWAASRRRPACPNPRSRTPSASCTSDDS